MTSVDIKKQYASMPAWMSDRLDQMVEEQLSVADRPLARSKRKWVYRAAIAAILVLASGRSVYAVNEYKTVRVFLDKEITSDMKAIHEIQDDIMEIQGVDSVKYVDGEAAWDEFSSAFLTEDMISQFDENPLADDSNIEVKIHLFDNTHSVMDEIQNIEGVRQVSTVRELKQ